ncbi:hypothetical protein KUCAC02_012378, partial [Chaenocephalus aceratus]
LMWPSGDVSSSGKNQMFSFTSGASTLFFSRRWQANMSRYRPGTLGLGGRSRTQSRSHLPSRTDLDSVKALMVEARQKERHFLLLCGCSPSGWSLQAGAQRWASLSGSERGDVPRARTSSTQSPRQRHPLAITIREPLTGPL